MRRWLRRAAWRLKQAWLWLDDLVGPEFRALWRFVLAVLIVALGVATLITLYEIKKGLGIDLFPGVNMLDDNVLNYALPRLF